MPGTVDQRIGILDILSTTAKTGAIRCKLGDRRENLGLIPDAPMWGLDGFVSRPNDPDDDGAAQAFYLLDGYEVRVLGTRDNRFADKVGSIKPGDRAIVSKTPARFLLKKDRDALTLYTEGPDGAMMADFDGSKGEVIISCGAAVIHMTNDSISIMAGGSSILVDKDGVNIAGKHFGANCGSGNLGLVAPTIPPIPPVAPLMSIIMGPAGIVGVPSQHWTVAP